MHLPGQTLLLLAIDLLNIVDVGLCLKHFFDGPVRPIMW